MKLSRWLFLIVMCLGFILISGCADDEEEGDIAGPDRGNWEYGTLHGLVMTQTDNAPLSDIQISYVVGGYRYETYSDSTGYYICPDIPLGTYTFTFTDTLEGSNLAMMFKVVSFLELSEFDSSQTPDPRYFEITRTENITMYRLDAGIEGSVYADEGGRSLIPAASAVVKMVGFKNIEGGILNVDFETTTDTTGYYSFSDLPALEGVYGIVSVLVMPWTYGDVDFGAEVKEVALISGDTVNAENITLSISAPEIVMISNNFSDGLFSTAEDIQIVFNRPVDPEQLIASLYLGMNSEPLGATLSEDGLQLTMNPIDNLQAATDYTIYISGRGTNFVDFSFGVIPGAVGEVLNLRTVDGIYVVDTNVLTQGGTFPVDGDIYLVFTEPLDIDRTIITFTEGATAVIHTASLDTQGVTLTISPAYALIVNTLYSLTVSGHGINQIVFTTPTYDFLTQQGIELTSSNLYLNQATPRQDVGTTETLTFTFSMPVDINHLDNDFYFGRFVGGDELLADFTFSSDSTALSVDPLGTLESNVEYEIQFLAHSTIPGDSYNFNGTFITARETVVPGQVTGLAVDTTGGYVADYNDIVIPLIWNTVADADNYEVFAYDDNNVTYQMLIATVAAAIPAFAGTHQANITLPAEFDWLAGDGVQTPFSNGIGVSFIVRALNVAGPGTFSSELVVTDETPPDISAIGLAQDISANNLAGTVDLVVQISIVADVEYLSSDPPDITFSDGGDPAFTLTAAQTSWQLNPNMRNGVLTITVPAGQDGSGDILTLSGLIDNSGNQQAVAANAILF